MKKKVMIAGPTASGKTNLAIHLAEQIDAEIISADSRQCYRFLDIGTAKPTDEELNRVRHYNISVLDPDEDDTVADFKRRADQYTDQMLLKEKRVIFCGGSTLHLQSLIKPLDDIPSADPENVERLQKEAEEKDIESLFKKLERIDPEYAVKMDGMNRQRIIRALDVWQQTGKPFSSFHSGEPIELPEDLAVFALHHPRPELHRRISERTENMLKMGFVEEVKKILEMGYSPDLQSLQTVGYRQAIQYLNGEISKEKMVKDIKTATRRYAKRQITWLRRWPFVHWLDMHKRETDEVLSEIITCLEK
jgi:tRNA dimethylallyltransferase